ncbi:hypothetical protein NXH76_17350 [Blautia schinkii]|nr:hypothetical protein [Blautia schinkii]
MADKRMFTKKIIDSDAFLDMPLSTQALYFHLAMRADDDGFLNNANKILRIIGAAQNDYDLLVAKRFVIQFPDGICVIKHWRMHNYIQKDRYKETQYKDEKSMLGIKKNGAYTLDKKKDVSNLATGCVQSATTMYPECIQSVSGLEAQVRLGKVSIDKDRYKDIVDTEASTPPAHEKKHSDDSFELQCVDMLICSCLESFPKARVPKTEQQKEKWADEIEKMKRIDKLSEDEIKEALQYATTDRFWKTNIRSTKKFREKFEVLITQSRNGKDRRLSPMDDLVERLNRMEESYEPDRI